MTSLLVGTVLSGAGRVSAAEPDDPATDLTLISQTPTVAADGVFVAQAQLGDLPAEGAGGLAVSATVYSLLGIRAQLDETPTEALNRFPLATLDELPVDPDGVLTVRIPLRPGDPFDDVERVWIPDPGVYPIVIELRDEAGVVASVRTDLIRLPGPDDAPLVPAPVLLLVGVRAAAATDGGLTITEATELLNDYPDPNIAVLLGDGVIAELVDDPARTRAFSAAVGVRTVTFGLEPELDPSALAAIDHDVVFAQVLESNRTELARLGLTADPTTLAVGAVPTREGAELLTSHGVHYVIDPGTTGLNGFVDTANGRLTVVGLTTEPDLRTVEPATVRAQRLLARRLLPADQSPESEPAAPIVAIDTFGAPVATMSAVLAAVQSADVVVSTSLGAATTGLATEPLPLPLTGRTDLRGVADSLSAADERLATYRSFHVDGGKDPARFDAALSDALAVDLQPSARSEAIAEVMSDLDEELATISLPDDQSFTLAARSVPIPLTIENRSQGPRRVLLHFSSDKVVVAEQDKIITIQPGTSSIDVLVEARSLGVSPLQVSVLSPDGQRVLASTRFQLRSTAIPGLGLLISAVALLLLATWWYLVIRRKRSSDPSRSEAEAAPGAAPEGALDRDVAMASGSVST